MEDNSISNKKYDIVVIGGGVNGVGIARDAAGRGLSVLLCEKDDLAQHTSSASTKLIHGGLRYLEHYDFKLVRHALQEREVLLRAAPHIIWPMRFVLPHHKALRPRWLIRLGLFIYDHIGGRKMLPASNSVNLGTHVSGKSLKPEFTAGFEYSDCWVQDSRLVVLSAMDAKEHGAEILTRTRCVDLTRHDTHWEVLLKDQRADAEFRVSASVVINASGPWVERTLHMDETNDAEHGVRLVKGSHVVVPKLFDHPYTYIFQNSDNRVLFAVPYEDKYTLLGTTDVEVNADPDHTEIEQSEIDYICESVSEYFEKPVLPETVVWTFSGVRPLYDDSASSASKVTRDYKLHLDTDDGAPILSVYGGKITTYRKLSEEVIDLVLDSIGRNAKPWTETSALPGGDIPDADFERYLEQCQGQYSWMDEAVLYDYVRNYGTRVHVLLKNCESVADLGSRFGDLIYQREIEYLVEHEWASTAEDILWRRSRKGLHVPDGTSARIQQFLDESFVYASSQGLKRVS